jgi:hypothetical protein
MMMIMIIIIIYLTANGLSPGGSGCNADGGEWLTWRPGRFNAWKEPRFLLSRGLDGPQSRSGGFGKERNLLPLPEFEPLIIQPVLTTLSWLIFWGGGVGGKFLAFEASIQHCKFWLRFLSGILHSFQKKERLVWRPRLSCYPSVCDIVPATKPLATLLWNSV